MLADHGERHADGLASARGSGPGQMTRQREEAMRCAHYDDYAQLQRHNQSAL